MLYIAVFVLALLAVFAINVAIALRTRDELVANSTSFCWMSVTPDDVEAAARASEEQHDVQPARLGARPVRRTARAGI